MLKSGIVAWPLDLLGPAGELAGGLQRAAEAADGVHVGVVERVLPLQRDDRPDDPALVNIRAVPTRSRPHPWALTSHNRSFEPSVRRKRDPPLVSVAY